MRGMTPLWQLDAAALRAGFAAGDFSPVDALEACLDRVRECQPAVNAFVHVDPAPARVAAADSAARWARRAPIGPLDGIPLSLKDNLHAAGMPTTWGSQLLDPAHRAADEVLVSRLRSAGAVPFGKTNLPEFALQGITDNRVAGLTRNPWDPTRTPGGSSGGAAAAVACGCGPLAVATDGGGSTRRPASHCGVIGFKPSAGAIARGAGLPEIFGAHEVPGVLARAVDDVVAAVQVLAPSLVLGAVAEGARILYVPRFGEHPVDAGIAREVAQAAAAFASLGFEVTESASAAWAESINELWPAFSARCLSRFFDDDTAFARIGTRDEARCSAATRATLRLGREAGAIEQRTAAAIEELEAQMKMVFGRFDAILTPATAALQWPVSQEHPPEIDGQAVGPRGHAVFTAFANAAGLPAIAVPTGFVGRLPTGFQLVAARGADALVLSLARAYVQANPRDLRWPNLP
jgi:aspartyl-tRNA(Asn)/glutamyl-tRNA(Gln) amidotransferase subunit A